MPDMYNFEISIKGRPSEVEAVAADFSLRGQGNFDDLRIEIEWLDEYGVDEDESNLTFSGICAYDEAEMFAHRLIKDDKYNVQVEGMIQGEWRPMELPLKEHS
jgi:hypothetical protein